MYSLLNLSFHVIFRSPSFEGHYGVSRDVATPFIRSHYIIYDVQMFVHAVHFVQSLIA